MERSSFFNAVIENSIPDRAYLAEDFARYFSTFIGNGVFPNPSNQLQVVAVDNNMQIRVRQGKAWINGYFYENTDDYILTITPADGVLNRIDRIALRLDFLERKIKAVVKKGDYSSSPIAKNLQRDADMYEVGIADIKINAGVTKIVQSDVTDLRLNKELCGIVHGTVDQVDTTAIFNQFQSWYSTTKTNYDNDINKWTDDKKKAFDTWYASNTQAWGNEFQVWFSTIKDKLNGDIAAKLTTDVNNRVIKPTTAVGNNIAIFDTNQDKLKDSGKSIGNTSGKILELPTGLALGDLLRVGVNGQVERLPKGVDGQVIGYKNSLPQPLNPPSGGYELIATADLTNQFQVDFANINKDYKEILMVCKGMKLMGMDASNLPHIIINDGLNLIFSVTADTNELIGSQLSLKIDTSAPYMTSYKYFSQEKSNTMPQPTDGYYYKNFLRPNSDLKLVIKSNSQLSFPFKQGEVKLYGIK